MKGQNEIEKWYQKTFERLRGKIYTKQKSFDEILKYKKHNRIKMDFFSLIKTETLFLFA